MSPAQSMSYWDAPTVVEVKRRLCVWAKLVGPRELAETFDDTSLQLLHHAAQRVRCTEASIWLVDREARALRMMYNTGPRAEQLVDVLTQPLSAGIISLVFQSEQGLIENRIRESSSHSKQVDDALSQETVALVAVPLHLFGVCVGVLSSVHLEKAPDTSSNAAFRLSDLRDLEMVSSVLQRLVEHQALTVCLERSNA